MEDIEKIKSIFEETAAIKSKLAQDQDFLNLCSKVANIMVDCFKADCKILFCGNGGSAADAQHLAAEFSGRFYTDRDPLYSEALHVNTSYITAVANDYSFDDIYSRLVKAKIRKGDILVGISTSGNSKNVLNALEQAKKQGGITVGFTGEKGGSMKAICDYTFCIPSNDTPRIQEAHIVLGHILCELVETNYFKL